MYAGVGRRFFDDFRQSNRVFLNLPGFNAVDSTFDSEEEIRRRLAMSDEINRYIRGSTQTPPSRNPANYSPYPYDNQSSDGRSFSAELGNIDRLFVDAKAGDLVLSPSSGHFEPFLVGEIVGPWSKGDDLAVERLLGEIVPARKVRWLNVALARRDFPVRVSKRLQNRHAITRLDDDYYADVFDKVYPSYSWKQRSKLDLFGDGYTGKDPLQPFLAAKLLKYVIASAFAFTEGEMDDFQAMEIDDAINRFYDEDLIEELHQNFNSPGKFSVISRRAALASLVSAGLIVATGSTVGSFSSQKDEAEQRVIKLLQVQTKVRRRLR